MKRSILFTTVALAAFASGYVGSSSIVSGVSMVTRVATEEGDPCELPNSLMSGYMVSGAFAGEWICVANSAS